MPRIYPVDSKVIQSRYIPTIPILHREISTPPSESSFSGFQSWERERERLAKVSGKSFKNAEDFRENLPKFLQDSKNYHLL